MNVFFSSDLHWGHQRGFLYEPRGFPSIEEHDEAILNNINKLVRPQDTLFVLGDLMLNDNEKGMEYLRAIKCNNVRVILGNHDSQTRQELYQSLPNFSVLGYAYPFVYKKKNFMLSHYPMLTQNMDDDKKPWQKTWNLCGHSHTKNKFDPITHSIHVELDAWDNKPVEIEQILELIRGENNGVAHS